MENILNKEPVLRVQKKLDEYNKDLKAIVLNSSARTAQEAATEVVTLNDGIATYRAESCLSSGYLRRRHRSIPCRKLPLKWLPWTTSSQHTVHEADSQVVTCGPRNPRVPCRKLPVKWALRTT